jgi:ribosome modulation factor
MTKYQPATIKELAIRKHKSYIECYRAGWQAYREGKNSSECPPSYKMGEFVDWLKGWQAAADVAANPFKIVGFTMRVTA